MYNETYEDYIRSILGYPPMDSYNNNYQGSRNQNTNYETRTNTELEKCYPEIYKIVYPMITKKCNNVRRSLTDNDIENMTDEIYYALEERNEIQLNINLTNDVRTTHSNTTKAVDKKPEVEIKEVPQQKREVRQIDRGLHDLIKILLIRELFNKPNRPSMPGPRPPFRPGDRRFPFNREFEATNYDIFEY